MAKHIATGTPTQVAHPWKSVVRTFVAAAVGIGVAWLVRTLGVDLTALSQPIIDSVTTGAWAVATGLAQWLLTRPQLQGFWAAIGLGTGVENEPEQEPTVRVGISPERVAEIEATMSEARRQQEARGYPIADAHESTASPDRHEN